MRRCLIPICALCLLAATAVAAGDHPVAVAVTGGPTLFAQDDVGDLVWRVNDAAAPRSMDDLDGGEAWGAALGFGLTPALTAGLGYEHFSAESELVGGEAGARFALPAHAVRAFLEYRGAFLPWLEGGAGVGAGLVIADGEQHVDPSLIDVPAGDYEGEGLLLEAYWLGDVLLDENIALTLSLGYRHAEIDNVKIDDARLRNADNSFLALDYSGMLLRVGLRVRL